MSARRLAIIAVVAVFGLAGRLEGQAPPQAAAPPKPGSVSGRITGADTGRPLRRAQVTLRSASATGNVPPITGATNSRGQYEVKNVPPGSYQMDVRRTGYLRLQYGQGRPGEQGLSVTVRAGEATQNIDVTLPRGGVLAGTIFDELGEPYPGVRVEALALKYRNGQRSPFPSGSATTDDLGQFRMADLEPGRYWVVAASTETWKTTKGDVYGYASTFFPGAQMAQAQVVTLGLSEVKADLHFSLQPSRAVRVSGRLQRETGEPMAGTRISLLYTYPNAGFVVVAGARSTQTEADGSFQLKNVTAGYYNVVSGGASQMVNVGDGDVEGMFLVAKRGSTVSGVVVTDEGDAPPPFPQSGVRVLLQAPSDNVLPTVRVVSVDTDWSFKLQSLGGPFLFRLVGLPDDWTLGAVRLGESDISDRPWDVPTGGKEIGGLQLVVTRKVGRVSGVVLDARGNATSAATVVIFSDDPGLWLPYSRCVRVARPDAEGRFSISGLPAGAYRAIARPFVEEGEWEAREFLDAARDAALRFELIEGGSETITVKLPLAGGKNQ